MVSYGRTIDTVGDGDGMICGKSLHGIFHVREGASRTEAELCVGRIAMLAESLASGADNEGK